MAQQGLLPIEERNRQELIVTGLSAGGLWELIPQPENLDERGLVEVEYVPKMFGPVAGARAGTPAAAG